MAKRNFDVLIVGCGPIGSYAAWQFASRGLEVIALEKAEEGKEPSRIGAFHFEHVSTHQAHHSGNGC